MENNGYEEPKTQEGRIDEIIEFIDYNIFGFNLPNPYDLARVELEGYFDIGYITEESYAYLKDYYKEMEIYERENAD